MPDREKIIEGLECCAALSGDECSKCPYGVECRDTDLPYGMPHLASDALALLKEQPDIVLCKDCKHHGEKYTHANGYEYVVCWRDGYGIHKLANGFCDCGERAKT